MDDSIELLLNEIRKNISDNKNFIKKLREESIDSEEQENLDTEETPTSEDDFEEL